MYPSVFPTNANFPEEKFRFHALRNAAFVSPLPRGFNQQWHLQYSAFTDKKLAIFDDLTRATRAILRLREDAEESRSSGGDAATPAPSDAQDSATAAAAAVQRVFTTYLMRNVRRLDERTSHMWMKELASGTRTAAELTQAHGVPFKQWRAVPGVSKCPLLEFVVRYRPGFAEATWFIRINVVYTEMRELERDSALRTGDWFFSPRRNLRRNQGWTDKLVDYLHSVARQAALESSAGTEGRTLDKLANSRPAANGAVVAGAPAKSNAGHVQRSQMKPRLRHGEAPTPSSTGTISGASAALGSGGVDSSPPTPLTMHEKWSYVLKLSEYQFKMGLLDRAHYFDGILSLLQKSLTPRSQRGSSGSTRCSAVLALGVNGIMELISVVQKLLPEILLTADAVLLLVKTILQHLRYLLPPGRPVPAETTGSALQEELLVSLCQLLRDVLLNGNDVLVRLEDNGEFQS
ncbi:unnamed protein product [Phytophthora lilii]|uniref:Unnamed protein product n=1 Tax=Phytophthora lilii TaxID=2077276 RepID=A0A9W6TKT0_9STRA|nr:unnamed protein product [Phytophthora lilii]